MPSRFVTCVLFCVLWKGKQIYREIVKVNSDPASLMENVKYIIYLSALLTEKAECRAFSVFFNVFVQNRFKSFRWCIEELTCKSFYWSVTLTVPHMQQVVLACSYAESLWKWRGDYKKDELLATVCLSLLLHFRYRFFSCLFSPFSFPLVVFHYCLWIARWNKGGSRVMVFVAWRYEF